MARGRRAAAAGSSFRTWSKTQLAAVLAAQGTVVPPAAHTRTELVRLLESGGFRPASPPPGMPRTYTKQALAEELGRLGTRVNPDAITRRELVALLRDARART